LSDELAGKLSNFQDMRPTSLVLRRLGLFAIILCGLIILYVLVYAINSANGHYDIMMVDVGRIEAFGWVPSGVFFDGHTTENEQRWDLCMFYFYYPLWRADYAYFHPWKDAYITDDQVDHWEKMRRLDDFAYLSSKLPQCLDRSTIIIVLGVPTRTNLLANGLSRWEYDYQNTNRLAFGSLFFNGHGIFQGSSTNANAQTPELITPQTPIPAGEE
jgi:hypothetical protein